MSLCCKGAPQFSYADIVLLAARRLKPENHHIPHSTSNSFPALFNFFCQTIWRFQFFCTFAPLLSKWGAIAQLVEQRTENPCVPGSIPGGTTQKRELSNGFSFCVFAYAQITFVPTDIIDGKLRKMKNPQAAFFEVACGFNQTNAILLLWHLLTECTCLSMFLLQFLFAALHAAFQFPFSRFGMLHTRFHLCTALLYQ